jgi:hypothetical protein
LGRSPSDWDCVSSSISGWGGVSSWCMIAEGRWTGPSLTQFHRCWALGWVRYTVWLEFDGQIPFKLHAPVGEVPFLSCALYHAVLRSPKDIRLLRPNSASDVLGVRSEMFGHPQKRISKLSALGRCTSISNETEYCSKRGPAI